METMQLQGADKGTVLPCPKCGAEKTKGNKAWRVYALKETIADHTQIMNSIKKNMKLF